MKLIAGLLLVVIALLSVMLYRAYEPEQWSYVVFSPKDESLVEELDKVGSLGYEVVSARRASNGDRNSPIMSYEMILKRRGAPLRPVKAAK
jgi:hypothetical protein